MTKIRLLRNFKREYRNFLWLIDNAEVNLEEILVQYNKLLGYAYCCIDVCNIKQRCYIYTKLEKMYKIMNSFKGAFHTIEEINIDDFIKTL